jgi:heptosyltransferase II
LFHGCVKLVEKAHPPLGTEAYDIAWRETLRRFDKRQPARSIEPFDQRRRDVRLAIAAPDPPAMQIHGKNLGVVDDERIAPAQERGQIVHGAVVEPGRPAATGLRRNNKEPRAVAWRDRPQRDAVLRQDEIKQIRSHFRDPSRPCYAARQTFFPLIAEVHYNRHIATFGAAINVTPTAVIQVKPGIGDVIWHLPFVRAIAAAAPGGQVTFLAPPSSCAKELLAAEPRVGATIYFEHSGSEFRRGINLIRLAALMRRQRFHSIWILDRTIRPALAAASARIPERIGIGLGVQNLFITNPGIGQDHFHDHPIDWLRALMTEMRVPLTSTEPDLCLPEAALTAIGQKFESYPRPWLVVGIGASHPDKDWSDRAWTEFLPGLHASGTVFLIGGPANAARAENLIALSKSQQAVNACALTLTEAAALLRHADLFVGPSSGPLNLAAAGATEAFGLFGSTPVLTYSKFIHAIVPDGGPRPGGMERISPAQVLDEIAPYLSRRKASAQTER